MSCDAFSPKYGKNDRVSISDHKPGLQSGFFLIFVRMGMVCVLMHEAAGWIFTSEDIYRSDGSDQKSPYRGSLVSIRMALCGSRFAHLCNAMQGIFFEYGDPPPASTTHVGNTSSRKKINPIGSYKFCIIFKKESGSDPEWGRLYQTAGEGNRQFTRCFRVNRLFLFRIMHSRSHCALIAHDMLEDLLEVAEFLANVFSSFLGKAVQFGFS